MIHRIEAGWVQVNDALSKRERRERRRRRKPRVREGVEEQIRDLVEEKVTINLVA